MKHSAKYGIIIFGIILFSNKMFSQDTINFKNGEKKIALISEVTSDEVKYKNYFNQNGPDYKISKKEIYSISYKNGFKETFNSIKKDSTKKNNSYVMEMQYKKIDLTQNYGYMTGGSKINTYEAWRQMSLKHNKEIDLHITKARNANAMKHAFGWSAIPVGIVAALFYEASIPETQYVNGGYTSVRTSKNNTNQSIAIGLGLGSAACVGTSFYMNSKKKEETEKARKLYNKIYFEQ